MKAKDAQFNYNPDLEEPLGQIRNVRASRAKFLRDLNYKNNTGLKKINRNKMASNLKAKQNQDNFVKNARQRQQSIEQMDSLLERAIPGAKIIKGEWKDHKLNGDVIIQYDNGSSFVGRYQNGTKIQGKMIYSQASCEYEGGFFGQKFSGYGKLTYYEGRSIEGEWDNMQFIGKATITYPNGDLYYGPVDQNLYKHGEGYIFLNNGYKYIGMFKHGSITGVGTYYKDEKLLAKGLWQKGKLMKEIAVDELDTGQIIDLTISKDRKKCNLKTNNRNYNDSQQSLDSASEKSSILLLKSKQKNFLNEFYV